MASHPFDDYDDDELDRSFVSEGLANLVGQLDQKLSTTRMDLDDAKLRSNARAVDPVDDIIPPMIEDEEGIEHREAILRRLMSPSADAYTVPMDDDDVDGKDNDENALERQLMAKYGFSAEELGGRAVSSRYSINTTGSPSRGSLPTARSRTPQPKQQPPSQHRGSLLGTAGGGRHVDDFDTSDDDMNMPSFVDDDLQPPGLLYDNSFDDMDSKPKAKRGGSRTSASVQNGSTNRAKSNGNPALVDDFASSPERSVEVKLFGSPAVTPRKTPDRGLAGGITDTDSEMEPSPKGFNPAAFLSPNTAMRMALGGNESDPIIAKSPSKPGIFANAFKAPVDEEVELVLEADETMDTNGNDADEEDFDADSANDDEKTETKMDDDPETDPHLENEQNYFVNEMQEGPHLFTPPSKDDEAFFRSDSSIDSEPSVAAAKPSPPLTPAPEAKSASASTATPARTPAPAAPPVATSTPAPTPAPVSKPTEQSKTPSFAAFLAMAKEQTETTMSPSAEPEQDDASPSPATSAAPASPVAVVVVETTEKEDKIKPAVTVDKDDVQVDKKNKVKVHDITYGDMPPEVADGNCQILILPISLLR